MKAPGSPESRPVRGIRALFDDRRRVREAWRAGAAAESGALEQWERTRVLHSAAAADPPIAPGSSAPPGPAPGRPEKLAQTPVPEHEARQAGELAQAQAPTGRPLAAQVRDCERRWHLDALDSARMGDAESMSMVSDMFEVGWGCVRNLRQAAYWRKQHAKQRRSARLAWQAEAGAGGCPPAEGYPSRPRIP